MSDKIPEVYALEDEEGVTVHWPAPKYQRVCAQGHLVTDLWNSYEVSRGKDGTSYACKRCQLEANARQKEKKQGTTAGEPFEETPDTPEHRDEIETEHAPGPDEKPGDARSPLQIQLDRIESKMDAFIADRHPHIATRILTDQIAQLEAQIAELKKGPALADMSFDQLKAKAAELGIEIPKGLRSAGARKLIEEHLDGQPDTGNETVAVPSGDPQSPSDEGQEEAQQVIAEAKFAAEDDIVDAEVVEDDEPAAEQEDGEPAPRRRRRSRRDEEG